MVGQVSGARTGEDVMQRHPREGWKAARQVMEARTGRPVTRRDFLKTSAGAGIALPSLAAIMAACTNPRDTSPDNPNASGAQLGKAAPDNPVRRSRSSASPSRTACRRRRAPRCRSTTGTRTCGRRSSRSSAPRRTATTSGPPSTTWRRRSRRSSPASSSSTCSSRRTTSWARWCSASSSARSTRATSRTWPTCGTRCRARSTTWDPSTRSRTSCTRPASRTGATRSPTT